MYVYVGGLYMEGGWLGRFFLVARDMVRISLSDNLTLCLPNCNYFLLYFAKLALLLQWLLLVKVMLIREQ
jgi:hypothetical protein